MKLFFNPNLWPLLKYLFYFKRTGSYFLKEAAGDAGRFQ